MACGEAASGSSGAVIVAPRVVLQKIMSTPYQRTESWTLCATRLPNNSLALYFTKPKPKVLILVVLFCFVFKVNVRFDV